VVGTGVVVVVGGTAEEAVVGGTTVGDAAVTEVTTDVLEPPPATVLAVDRGLVVLVEAAFEAEHAPRIMHGSTEAVSARASRAPPWLRSPATKGFRS
jgi:hypothetical protein